MHTITQKARTRYCEIAAKAKTKRKAKKNYLKSIVNDARLRISEKQETGGKQFTRIYLMALISFLSGCSSVGSSAHMIIIKTAQRASTIDEMIDKARTIQMEGEADGDGGGYIWRGGCSDQEMRPYMTYSLG